MLSLVASRVRGTPMTKASSCSASHRGLSTPAAASRSVASRSKPPRSATVTTQSLERVRIDERLHDGVEVTVEDLVEVVGLEAHAMVADAVLREVIGADPLAAVHGPHLRTAHRGRLGISGLLRSGEQPGPQDAHRALLVLQLALLVLARDDDAGGQVG